MNKGFKPLLMGAAVCLALAGCGGQHAKHHHGHGAHMSGMGDRGGFNGQSEAALHEHRVYHFGFDRYDVPGADYPALRHHAAFLAKHPGKHVRIEGHTDERGSREYNIGLGERRAKAVADILYSEGAHSNQISIVSYGKEKPVMHGLSEEAHSMNRRAVLVYED